MCHLRYLLVLVLFVLFLGNGSTQEPQTMKQIKNCLSQDGAVICLKERILELMNETLLSDNPVTLYGVFDIVKDPNYVNVHSHDEFLPRDLAMRNEKLNELLYQKIQEFFESRSVKLNLGHMFEARGKKDKKGGMLMMGGLAMAGMMAQMFMGKIAFMAGAALLVAKLALLLSTVIGFKKLSGGGGGGRDFKTNMLLMGGMTMAGIISKLVMASVGFLAGAVTVLVKSIFFVLVSKRFDIKDFIINDHTHKDKHKKKKKPHNDKEMGAYIHKDKDKDHNYNKDKHKNKCKYDYEDFNEGGYSGITYKNKKKKKIKNDKDHIQFYNDNNYNLRE